MSKTRTATNKSSYRCATKVRSVTLAVMVMVCSVQLLAIAGCHRGFYRRQADAEAKRLITEKAGQRWSSATGDIEINPMSRMFDPFSADHPPIPPDDPASHKFMHEVDDKPGYPHWHSNGNIDFAENPEWQSYLPVNENGAVVLSLSDAYKLALIHSTDLQEQREELYLSALEVSIQRFGFDSQLFTGFNSFLTSSGSLQSPTGESSTTLASSLGANGEGFSLSRMGITGANFVVGLANTIIWEFSGNNTQSANSLINFSLIQPLLRDAGRQRILESLTQAERILLANVRQLERFRRGFYLEITTGRAAGAGPSQASGAFLASPGLAGSNVGGYLGLLQQKQIINNLEFSVAQFESLLIQFRELFERDRIDKLQVAQFESSVYGQQQSLLNARITYQNSLDAFKILIGLPPDVEVEIQDPYLDGFKLIDDDFSRRLESIKALRSDVSIPVIELGASIRKLIREAILEEEEGNEVVVDNRQVNEKLKSLLPLLKQTRELAQSIKKEDRSRVQQDIDRLENVREDRLNYLANVKRDIESGRLSSQIEPRVFTEESVPAKEEIQLLLDDKRNRRSLVAKLNSIIDEIDDRIDRIEMGEDPKTMKGSVFYKSIENDFASRIPDLLTEIDSIILEMALLQAKARTNAIEIVDVNIDSNTAFETARCLRRDWMNARAALVDSWRQIEFFADQLEADVDLVLTGEIGNANADNPFRIRFDDGNISAGFQFDAPIVRQAERNTYRTAQINYQQARRSFYQFEDSINQSLRQTVRNIGQNKLLFELNRQNIQVNIDQVELARARLIAPPGIGAVSNGDGNTATFLTGAINGLTGQQNAYVGLWTEYEVLRRSLDFDMGTMEIDSQFEWVDPGEIDATIGSRVAAREGIAENDRFCCGLQQAQAQAYQEYIVSEEVIDSQYIEQPGNEYDETDAVLDPPVDVHPYESDATKGIEIDSVPVPDVPKVQELPPPPPVDSVPLIDSASEPPSLSQNFPAKSPIIGEVISRPALQNSTAAPSLTKSSRAGFLDPFRRGKPRGSKPRLIIGGAQGSPSDVDQGDFSADTLKRAFEPIPEPPITSVQEPSARTAKAQATFKSR